MQHVDARRSRNAKKDDYYAILGIPRVRRRTARPDFPARAASDSLLTPLYCTLFAITRSAHAQDAGDRQIKKAYRKLAMKWHPDK